MNGEVDSEMDEAWREYLLTDDDVIDVQAVWQAGWFAGRASGWWSGRD